MQITTLTVLSALALGALATPTNNRYSAWDNRGRGGSRGNNLGSNNGGRNCPKPKCPPPPSCPPPPPPPPPPACTMPPVAPPPPAQTMPPATPPMMAAAPAQCAYFLSNNDENTVIAARINRNNGLLIGEAKATSTGGRGAAGINMGTGQPAEIDPLFSQDAITVVGDLLFAVNPGDNSLTMMRIDAGDCLNLTPVGYPAAITNGEFPVSVTFSSAIMTACVACSGALDGVSCFSVDSQAGLTLLDDTPRRFNLEQTTPPVGPFNTVSDILFNGDSTALMVSVKGDPPNNNTGFLARYPINPETGLVGAEETMQTFSPSGTAVLFGFSNVVDDGDDENDTIVITDASFGAAVLPLPVISAASVAGPQVQELSFRTPIDNQTATCWSTYNPQTSTFYVTDVAQARLVEIDAADGAILKDLTLENSLNPGMIDLLHHNSGFVYSLNPSANGTTAINVFDVRGGPGQFIEVQSLAIEGVQATGRAMGMMLFPRMGAMMTGSD